MFADPLRSALDRAVAAAAEPSREALAPLIEYDRAHSGDLVRTLAVYLASGCNATRCAQALYLHRSGLLYRLSRIESLLGVRLESFQARVALEVSVLAIHADDPAFLEWTAWEGEA